MLGETQVGCRGGDDVSLWEHLSIFHFGAERVRQARTMDGHSTEECFPFYKFVFALPVLKQLNYVKGVEDYLKLVQKPEKFEIEM